jgi:hypothetical protein
VLLSPRMGSSYTASGYFDTPNPAYFRAPPLRADADRTCAYMCESVCETAYCGTILLMGTVNEGRRWRTMWSAPESC